MALMNCQSPQLVNLESRFFGRSVRTPVGKAKLKEKVTDKGMPSTFASLDKEMTGAYRTHKPKVRKEVNFAEPHAEDQKVIKE